MSVIFLTATGTEIGKTFVGVGLIGALRNRGREVAAIKPLVSGYEEWSAPASDPARLLEALGAPATPDEIARIAPWRFRAPVAPSTAAIREGRHMDYPALLEFCRSTADACNGVTVIEGIGGVMVPIDERHTVLDWIADLHVPAILVAGSYLGTISHTLTALATMRHRHVPVTAIVISETEGSSVPLADNVAAITHFSHGVPVLSVPVLEHGMSHAAFDALADLV
ncbi:MAG TPA: dethiobiotin synthase [Stellaceae bacterium]|nr:dethiobiotin synthase [Stellaceae bacterium]